MPLLACVALSTLGLVSCETTSNPSSSPYVSNGPIEGGYNPYPNGGGGFTASNSLLSSGTPKYAEAPPPPPSGYTMPEEDKPVSKPKPKTTTTSSKPSAPKPVASTSSVKTKPKPAASSTSTAGASKPKPKTTTTKSSGSSGGSHTVVQGDTLWAIARKNNTTVAKLKAANGLSSDNLKLGQKLKLP
jgi:LysM repeat protein